MYEFPIIYRDEDIVVVNKPAGFLVHKSRLARDRRTVMNLLRNQLHQWVWPVHRLDRGTTGVLAFALNPDMARSLCDLFASRDVHKLYLAIVRGWVMEPGETNAQIKDHETGDMLEAATRYWPIGRIELPYAVPPYDSVRYSLVGASPLSGRLHQIRRHLKHLNHPVIGDGTHGDSKHNRFFAQQFGVNRMFLHAHAMRFHDPRNGQAIRFEAGLDNEFLGICRDFGWMESLEQWLEDSIY